MLARLPIYPMVTHRCAEVATARAAMVLDHAGSMGLTEYHQCHAARRPHGLPFEDGSIAAQQLGVKEGLTGDEITKVITSGVEIIKIMEKEVNFICYSTG